MKCKAKEFTSLDLSILLRFLPSKRILLCECNDMRGGDEEK